MTLGGSDFRFRPDGSAIEPVTGGNGTFGLAFTDLGERFVLDTSNHAKYAIPLPRAALLRNPWVASPPPVANAADYHRIYPTSAPHPWRQARSEDPAWVRFYGEHETTPGGYFTSACGQMIYRAAAFPVEYRGDHFSCDPQNNLIHRCHLERDGAGFRVRRPEGLEEREFLTSTDKWFRPIQLATGPDGAIYVVDMYREIIEDYSAIPRFLQQQYGLIEGHDRGRLWRVYSEQQPERRTARPTPALSRATLDELVRLLDHPDAWWRHTAQRQLVERDGALAIDALREHLAATASSPGRLHTIHTLEQLGGLRPLDLQAALSDARAGVRVHALRLAERSLHHDGVRHSVERLAEDDDPRVRLQLAMTLGATPEPGAFDILVRLATEHGHERWMAAAIGSSIGDSAGRMALALLSGRGRAALHDEATFPDRARPVLALALQTVGARRREAEITAVLRGLASATAAATVDGELVTSALEDLRAGLRRGPGPVPSLDPSEAKLDVLLASRDVTVRNRAFELFAELGLRSSPLLAAAFERARASAIDPAVPLLERIASLAVLQSAPFVQSSQVVPALLHASRPVDLQLATVELLAASDDERVGALLLEHWSGLSPAVQDAVIGAIFARRDRLGALIDAMEQGGVLPQAIDRFHQLQLTESDDPDTRRRSRSLFAGASADSTRAERFERYADALAAPRDTERGRAVFDATCLPCHRLGDRGHAVGPDLASERARADQTLLADILEPSREITAGYASYVVWTRDGRIVSGVLASESATSVTLRQAEGVEHVVLRANVETMSQSAVSLMPEDLADALSPRDAADLIGFLRQRFGEPSPGPITLFDDEIEFVESLGEGSGEATLELEAPFAGQSSLAVTPPQRYSARIAGWEYPIREAPGRGEYRYLRLAWKSTGGQGVMVELAADGDWPPASSPRRRYFAGINTTDWRARMVAPAAPTSWTVVTVDLWRDNGDFTLTGIAPTAMGGVAHFDRIQLLPRLE